ncbi:MAG: RHS repeat domain-containing protein [Pirellulales bacterium]
MTENATFNYNEGVLMSVVDNITGDTTTYTYYLVGQPHAGRLQKILQPDDSSITYTYDVLGRVETLTTDPDDSDVNSEVYPTQYEYDAARATSGRCGTRSIPRVVPRA